MILYKHQSILVNANKNIFFFNQNVINTFLYPLSLSHIFTRIKTGFFFLLKRVCVCVYSTFYVYNPRTLITVAASRLLIINLAAPGCVYLAQPENPREYLTLFREGGFGVVYISSDVQ